MNDEKIAWTEVEAKVTEASNIVNRLAWTPLELEHSRFPELAQTFPEALKALEAHLDQVNQLMRLVRPA